MISLEIIFSDRFRKDYKRIKDSSLRKRIIRAIKKLGEFPETGKPLRYGLKGHRRLQVKPFRIIYRIEDNKVIINTFEHRKSIYKK